MKKAVDVSILPKSGEEFAYHVFVPAVQHRRANPGCTCPIIAVRTSLDGFQTMRLFKRVTSRATLEERFHDPLPGTAGKGVAFCRTTDPIEVTYETESPAELPPVVPCGPSISLDDILFSALALYA